MNNSDTTSLDDTDRHWIIKNEIDISTCFIDKRNALIQQCTDASYKLDTEQELALSGILLLDPSINSVHFDSLLYDELCSEYLKDLNINDISTSEIDEISYLKFANLMKVGNDSETDRFLHSSKLPINKLSILNTMWVFVLGLPEALINL